MKDRIIFIFTIILMIGLLYSCSANKTNLNESKSEVFESESDLSQSETKTKTTSQIPKKLGNIIKSPKGKLIINFFAEVNYKDNESYGTYKIELSPYTQNEVDKYILELFNDAEILNIANNDKIGSKLQENINGNMVTQYLIGKTAGEENSFDDYISFENIFIQNEKCISANMDLLIANTNDTIIANTEFTAENATKKAEEFFENYDNVGVFSVVSEPSIENGFTVQLKKEIEGIFETGAYIAPKGKATNDERDIFRADDITLGINNEGIYGFSSRYKSNITQVGQKESLLDFQKIVEKLSDALLDKFSWVDDEADAQSMLTINISNVNLEYKCILDSDENFKLIPVWNFYGTSSYTNKDGTTENYYGMPNTVAYLCVNAIDGSIVEGNYNYDKSNGNLITL